MAIVLLLRCVNCCNHEVIKGYKICFLTTHSASGLTDNDFIMAKIIDETIV